MNKLDKLICLLIFPSIVLKQIIDVTDIQIFVVVRVLFVGLFLFRISNFTLPTFSKHFMSYMLLIFISVGLIRTNGTIFTEANDLLTVVIFVIIFILFHHIARKDDSFKYVMYSLFGLLLMNIVFVILGFKNDSIYKVESAAPAIILSKIIPGSNFHRQLFPVSTGVNNYGVEIGLLVLYFILKMSNSYLNKIFAAVCVICLLFSDTRSAIIFIVLILLFQFWQTRKSIIIKILIIFVAVVATQALSLSAISRDNAQDAKTLNSRYLIWSVAALKTTSLTTSETLFGLGRFSSVPLGINNLVDLGYVTNDEYISYHNNFFQFYFDWGLLGLIFMLYLFVWALRKSYRTKQQTTFFLLLYYIGVGLTEATVSYHYQSMLVIFLFLVIDLESIKYKKPKKNANIHSSGFSEEPEEHQPQYLPSVN
jgi:O-antigen ligase